MSKISPATSSLKLFFLTKPRSNALKSSTILNVLFTLILVLLSLDFGFITFKSSRRSVLTKLYCALQTLAISVIFSHFYSFKLEDPVFGFWYCLYILEYITIVFVLLCTKKSTFFDFMNDLSSFDLELGVDCSSSLEFILLAGIGACLIFRSLLSLVYCTVFLSYCISETTFLVLFFIPLLSADVFLVVFFVIYYFLYNSLVAFTELVRSGYYNVVASHYLYKSLVEIADNVKSVYNPPYVVPLFFHTISMMITVFYPLIHGDRKQDGAVDIMLANASVLQVFITLFLPAFAAGLLASQAERLRIVLYDRLLQERDQKHTIDLERFIRYIEARPLKTTIWKVIPLDWKLPVIIINLSVTYLIVMLQFAHKY